MSGNKNGIGSPFAGGNNNRTMIKVISASVKIYLNYISRKNMLLSDLAERYIHELDRYLKQYQQTH